MAPQSKQLVLYRTFFVLIVAYKTEVAHGFGVATRMRATDALTSPPDYSLSVVTLDIL